MKYTIYPDSILENWGGDMRDAVFARRPYCLLKKETVRDLVTKLLEEALYGVLLETEFVKSIDPQNGIERRAKAAGHVKIILDSLGRDHREYDQEFVRLGLEMDTVSQYYRERVNAGSFYYTGLVAEKK